MAAGKTGLTGAQQAGEGGLHAWPQQARGRFQGGSHPSGYAPSESAVTVPPRRPASLPRGGFRGAGKKKRYVTILFSWTVSSHLVFWGHWGPASLGHFQGSKKRVGTAAFTNAHQGVFEPGAHKVQTQVSSPIYGLGPHDTCCGEGHGGHSEALSPTCMTACIEKHENVPGTDCDVPYDRRDGCTCPGHPGVHQGRTVLLVVLK